MNHSLSPRVMWLSLIDNKTKTTDTRAESSSMPADQYLCSWKRGELEVWWNYSNGTVQCFKSQTPFDLCVASKSLTEPNSTSKVVLLKGKQLYTLSQIHNGPIPILDQQPKIPSVKALFFFLLSISGYP
jgi:hypothetical protein